MTASFFWYFEYVICCFLASKVADGKPAAGLMEKKNPWVWQVASLLLFSKLSLCLWQFDYDMLRVTSLSLSCLESGYIDHFHKWGDCQYIISSLFLFLALSTCPFCLVLSLWKSALQCWLLSLLSFLSFSYIWFYSQKPQFQLNCIQKHCLSLLLPALLVNSLPAGDLFSTFMIP